MIFLKQDSDGRVSIDTHVDEHLSYLIRKKAKQKHFSNNIIRYPQLKNANTTAKVVALFPPKVKNTVIKFGAKDLSNRATYNAMTMKSINTYNKDKEFKDQVKIRTNFGLKPPKVKPLKKRTNTKKEDDIVRICHDLKKRKTELKRQNNKRLRDKEKQQPLSRLKHENIKEYKNNNPCAVLKGHNDPSNYNKQSWKKRLTNDFAKKESKTENKYPLQQMKTNIKLLKDFTSKPPKKKPVLDQTQILSIQKIAKEKRELKRLKKRKSREEEDLLQEAIPLRNKEKTEKYNQFITEKHREFEMDHEEDITLIRQTSTNEEEFDQAINKLCTANSIDISSILNTDTKLNFLKKTVVKKRLITLNKTLRTTRIKKRTLKNRFIKNYTPLCHHCHEPETIAHIHLICPLYEQIREHTHDLINEACQSYTTKHIVLFPFWRSISLERRQSLLKADNVIGQALKNYPILWAVQGFPPKNLTEEIMKKLKIKLKQANDLQNKIISYIIINTYIINQVRNHTSAKITDQQIKNLARIQTDELKAKTRPSPDND